ncbi:MULTISPECIES: gas vesicle protein GvpJ [Terribacillus]|jgi:gas vesicle structural protein|uniref:Gas vesicle protein A n=1 Tax=Terribacillus saccharophilus TaxID=361277 RepID=A0A268HHP1_9BACI|nr:MULTISPECIES: gas vesicle protein GvpJ [Terribacillus]MCM3226582.1 gas vesicle structural protein GvpA [Terribacillus saccharophilus]MEC0282114.1 gas vesicle structural protein GvpA [Terribacillus saccharophilus]MEC0289127.1 gas vesicle structural protein GvpA [Terribacillus saccharophilus]MEC0301568.1 gas vesicle structural protein GvpA [Terribacillus saccharophilus]PAD36297.1 gas vesicle protein GvpA [Terribacillus saccharophilus]
MAVQKSTDSSGLADVIDRILDKGIVIDAFVRVSVVGIEILTIEARVVIASVDTWLRYAEAVGLLRDEVQNEGLPEQKNERSNSLFSV